MILNMEKDVTMNLLEIGYEQKIGKERLTYYGDEIGFSLIDFWRWSESNLLSNATRGKFAEFIVGIATGLDLSSVRDEWGKYDLKSYNGIKIEVKSASYIQCWKQHNYSRISFSIKRSKYREDGIHKRTVLKRWADIYVFCLLKNKNQADLDPMKLEQWTFFVLPTYKIDNYERSQTSITLNSLLKLTAEISYSELEAKIMEAYNEQKSYKVIEDNEIG